MAARSRSLSFGWLFAGMVIILAVAIMLNLNHDKDLTTRIEESISTDNGDLKINWDRYPTTSVELSSSFEIASSGTYHLTGNVSDGAIVINAGADDVVRLILDNISIKNPTGPAIICNSADDLVIELVGKNFLEDGSNYATSYDESVKGVIFSESDLTLGGDGILNLTANYQDGIVSKDDLKFNGGEYNISSADDAIRGKDSVYITAGTFNIDAVGDAIKSTNETDANKGFVLIENGTFKIKTGDDAIHAFRQLITSGGDFNILKSYEGLEAQNIVISGGTFSIVASDDGINAGGNGDSSNAFAADTNCVVTISGGDIYINASGDGIDSNGYINFNGGSVVVDGPTNNGNGALDAGASIVMNGGKVIAVGASGMAESLGESSSIYNISVYFSTFQPAGTKIEIKNSADKTILVHTAAKTFNHLAAGSEDFALGDTYILYIDGEEYESFTISDIVTTLGNGAQTQFPGGQPGNQPPARPGM